MTKTHPIVPWPGGKTRLLPHLLPLLEARPHRTYVEAFAGGAAVLFAKPASKVEVINDTHSELVRLYRVVEHHLDEFMRHFRWLLSSRERFEWEKRQHLDALTDIQRAVRFYYLQRLSFGGKVAGQTFGVAATSPKRINLLRIEQDLSDAHLRLSGVVVEHLPWQDCLRRYDTAETLFFLDPPYWQTEGYGGEFGIEQYDELAAVMARLKGKAILTINDHAGMRKVFGRFRSKLVPITYTIGGKGRAERQERIYTSDG